MRIPWLNASNAAVMSRGTIVVNSLDSVITNRSKILKVQIACCEDLQNQIGTPQEYHACLRKAATQRNEWKF